MGNGLAPCLNLRPSAAPAAVRLVYWGGQTRLVTMADAVAVTITAGDVAAELPAPAADHAVCRADSFFVGLPVPVMSPGEELLPGRTYFVLPAARLGLKQPVLTAATLAALSPSGKKGRPLLAGGQCPFEYVKGPDGGAALIRVLPEFIEKVITRSDGGAGGRRAVVAVVASKAAAELCSTPELKRHYAQLVGPRDRPWSPRLETISECDRRSKWLRSPAALLSSR